MKIAIIILSIILFSRSNYAQDSLSAAFLESNYEFKTVLNFPVNDFDKEANEMLLAIGGEGDLLAFILKYTEDGETAYRKTAEFTADALGVPFINAVKMYNDPAYKDEKVTVCYGMPFRATEICILFSIQMNTIKFQESTVEDPSADAIEMAEKALDSNDIAKAAEMYNGVMYPMHYMNEDEVAGDLMKRGHAKAIQAYKEKNYTAAKRYMEEPFVYYLNQYYISIEDPKEFEERVVSDKESGEDYWNLKTFKKWVGDYGLFLYLAKDYEASIIINKYLVTMLPEMAGPYLQLADSYFDTGKKAEAKVYYRKYTELMQKLNKQKSIPSRVTKRS